jgi:hypothetical protein
VGFASKKLYLILAIYLVFFISFGSVVSRASDQRQKEDAVLNSADEMFHAMKKHQFLKVWLMLSNKSKTAIVDSVYKNLLKSNIKNYSKEQITNDFQNYGPLANSFWLAYLKSFSPAMVLDESVWQKVEFKSSDRADIVIKYKKSKEPFDLKMYKENNEWKIGLVETFGL